MLAELHGKFDPERADAVDRSEDMLTSAVFGAIRHLPRAAVGALLNALDIAYHGDDVRSASVELWPQVPMHRWPGTVVEPDVIITAGRQPVVFEAKLHSPFGLYPDRDTTDADPFHQLAVQYAAVRSWASGRHLSAPVVVAVTSSPQKPVADLARARADLHRLAPDVPTGDADAAFRWLPWWKIAAILDNIPDLHSHEKTLVADVLRYMDKREVRHVFDGFQPEDYWLVAAAQRVAADRVYPQIRAFIEDLAGVLDADGIGWSTPSYQSMWLPGGTGIKRPRDWTRGWLGVVFWPA